MGRQRRPEGQGLKFPRFGKDDPQGQGAATGVQQSRQPQVEAAPGNPVDRFPLRMGPQGVALMLRRRVLKKQEYPAALALAVKGRDAQAAAPMGQFRGLQRLTQAPGLAFPDHAGPGKGEAVRLLKIAAEVLPGNPAAPRGCGGLFEKKPADG